MASCGNSYDMVEVRRLVKRGASLGREFGGAESNGVQPIFGEECFTGKNYIEGIELTYGGIELKPSSASSIIELLKDFLYAEEGDNGLYVTKYRTKDGKPRELNTIQVRGQPRGKRTEVYLTPQNAPSKEFQEIPQTMVGYFDEGRSSSWIRVDKRNLKRTKTRKPSLQDILHHDKNNIYDIEIRLFEPQQYELINRPFVMGVLFETEKLLPKGLRYARTLESLLTSNQKKLGWNDIGGYKDLKEQLILRLEGRILNPEIYEDIEPSSMLLTGPPGTGKTLMTTAAITEIKGCVKIPFKPEYISNMLGSKDVGISKLFEWMNDVAEDSGKHVYLFYDEIEEIGSRFAGGPSVVTNSMLRALDGNESANFSIVATTNKPTDLDPALLRPGRFYPIFYVQTPDINDRTEILNILTRNNDVNGINIDEIARETNGYTGADLKELFKSARLNIIREKTKEVPLGKIRKSDILLTQNDLLDDIYKNRVRVVQNTESWEATFSNLLKGLKDVHVIGTRHADEGMFQ